MTSEYKKIRTGHFDCQLIFFGHEKVSPNYVFSGNNVRDCFVLHVITKGKGRFASAGKQMITLQAGDAFLLPQSIPCFYQADSDDPWEYSWIGLTGSSVPELISQSQFHKKYYLKQIQHSNFATSFDQLMTVLNHTQSLVTQLQIESFFFNTMAQLLLDFPGETQKAGSNSYTQFKYAKKRMLAELATGANVSDICASLHLSRSYFYTLFKKYTGMSPQVYLANLRITQAQELLTRSSQSLATIANLVGYKDPFTFSKAFKRETGISPSTYRNQALENDPMS